MRKLILSLFILSMIAFGLHFTQKSSAAVVTTLANAGTPLSAQSNYTWHYPITPNCNQLSGAVPLVAYQFTVTTSGSYTFTMNTTGFTGVIHLYQNSFDPNQPCLNQGNPQNVNVFPQLLITGSPLTVPLSNGFGSATWVAVFSAQNPNDTGTFSASVSGPAAVTPITSSLSILSQPTSKSVTSGCQQTLAVYASGPLPQTFQWYEGFDGDLTNSILIVGATSHVYTTPPLTSDKSYWLRITQGAQHVDSNTIEFKVYATNKTQFSGSLETNQTWNLTTSLCHPTGTFVHYGTTQIRIPVAGTYTVHITKANNFTGGYAINLYQPFDATSPCSGFVNASLNSDLIDNLQSGTYVVVVSATSPAELDGDYSGAISGLNECTLPETIEQALLISGNPLDKAITPGNSAALTFAYTGGSGGPKAIQWYKGFSGDTSQPIAGAILTNYTTPALSQSPPNEPAYYYYWARVNDPGQTTYADTRTAVINVLNPPITYSDVLSTCDETYTQVGGPTTFYKIFPFTVSTDGSYTFNVSASGFTPAVRLYQGFFSPNFPNINYYGPGATQNILASPNTFYLVITSTAANQTGSFTLTISGPALVIPTPRPIITGQPADKIVFRDQTATFNASSSTPDVSYQWFKGSCSNKTAVSGANSSSYTTPPMTDYQDYWVKVSYGVMYVNSNIAHVSIRPQAITDGYIIDEDTQLNVAAPGVLANDRKADSKTLTALKVTDPTLGTRTLSDDGALSYTPNANANGPDVFQYKVSDGTLESASENVAILVRSINDAPVMTGGSFNNHTFNEDSAGGTIHLGGVTFSPGGGSDEATQQLTYMVTTVPPASVGNVVLADNTTVVTANSTYTLSQIEGMRFKPAANGNGGPYPFTLTVTDNGTSYTGPDPKSITQSLNITVNAVADTPSATNATTDEDMKTFSGLVLNRNAADGAEVGYFKIGLIKKGTLYKNDGITQINNEQFITYAEGHAGLKFSPTANLFSPNTIFSFEVQASLTNQMSGLGGNPVTVTITVNPVADLPAVTGAATFVNLQSTSGLVFTRNPLDGSEIGFYKISSITNGTLYKTDGTTQISEGQYITVADGSAGLKFTPALDSTASGSFVVRGSANTSGNGLGPAVAVNITVSKYSTSTTISSTSPAPSNLDQEVTVNYSVLNTSGGPAPTGDVVVTVSGGAETCTGTIAAGSCTMILTNSGNPRTITAAYGGNSQFDSSTGTKDHIVKACTSNTIVTSMADDGTSGTLRYRVTNACAGSTITFDPTVFDPAHGPYTISLGTFGNIVGNLLIDKNLTIKGPGANILTVRRSTGSHVLRFRIFNITSGATVKISGLTIGNGYASGTSDAGLVGKGGGILNSGTLTLKECAVSGNKAGVQPDTSGLGGGIYSTASLTIIKSTISGNTAVTGGGGIYLEAGSTTSVVNSTLSGNTTVGNGGGLFLSGTAGIVNSTIADNTATVSGGGIYGNAGTLNIGNSIVAGNTSATGPDVLLLSGIINSNGHNLVGKNDGAETALPSGSPNVNADLVGTSNSPVLAVLGALADNGGPCPTQLPLPGSPALDSGNNANLPPDTFDLDGDSNTTAPLPVDQRGQARITNTTVDIGSTEASYAITASSGAGQSAVINSSFVTVLQASLTESGKPKGGGAVTFTAPVNGAGGAFNGNVSVTVTTDSNGLATAPEFIANGTVGNYSVVASLGAGLPSATFSLANTQAAAQVVLSNLTQVYDGAAKAVSATTTPSGLPVALTYDGSATSPINVGAYQVSATVTDPNYSGATTGTLNIGKAEQTINFGALPKKTFGDSDFTVSATASSGLGVSFTAIGNCTMSGATVTITGAGSCTITGSQGGDSNYHAAADVPQAFVIVLAPTASDGLISGRILAAGGTPVAGAVVSLSGTQTRKTITDANGNYHFSNVESSGFYTVTPSRVNYIFSPFNRSFSQLGDHTEVIFEASFNGDAANPLDTPEYFVRQQYVDVLGREPDESGFDFWSDRILECGGDTLCVNLRRRDVAAQFFIAQEFQQSGSFIYNLYKVSFSRRPRFVEYSIDREQVVGGFGLEAAKQAFAERFVQRAEFTSKYQSDDTAEMFVDSLLANLRQTTGVDLGRQRETLLTDYSRGANQTQSRSFVLRAVTEMPSTRDANYNSAFVLTEYFGYLRRDPDQGGYDFWLNVLNEFAGRDADAYARMVCSFITSTEYQQRFSNAVSHSNGECAP